MTIGILGSAFNPPTLGHADIVNQALAKVDKVILVPSANHPWKSNLLPFNTRLQMVKAMAGNFNNAVTVSDIESRMSHDSPIYTWQLMEALSNEMDTQDIVFICGPDVGDNWGKFERNQYIDRMWGKIILTDRTGIRSTKVRRMLGENDNDAIKFLHPNVLTIIKKENLYEQN